MHIYDIVTLYLKDFSSIYFKSCIKVFSSFLDNTRPTSEFPHPLSRVKQPAGYRVRALNPCTRHHLAVELSYILWLFFPL